MVRSVLDVKAEVRLGLHIMGTAEVNIVVSPVNVGFLQISLLKELPQLLRENI